MKSVGDSPPHLKRMCDLMYDEILKQLFDLKEEKQRIEEKEERIKAELSAQMQKEGVSLLENARIKVQLIGAQTRHKIDTKRLKKDYPDIAAKYDMVTHVSPYCKVMKMG